MIFERLPLFMQPYAAPLFGIRHEKVDMQLPQEVRTGLKDTLKELEKLRHDLQRKMLDRATYMAPVLLLAWGYVIAHFAFSMIRSTEQPFGPFSEFFFYISFFAGCFGSYWQFKPALTYKYAFKNKVIKHFLQEVGHYDYMMAGIPDLVSTGQDADIFPTGASSDWHTEDGFRGMQQDVTVRFQEAHITRKFGDKERTVYKGAMLALSFPKSFEGKVLVTRDKGTLLNKLSNWRREEKRVGFPDPKFERDYEVYGDDQVISRYIMDPAFMQQFRQLDYTMRATLGIKAIECAFFDNHVVFKLPHKKDMMEPANIFRHADAEKPLARLYHELTQIQKMVDVLVQLGKKTR